MPTTDLSGPSELTVDQLATRAGLPVRTIREYQTTGLLPGPERRGRVGIYGPTHLARLALIGRLQARGYSLAGIRDLVTSWSDGADLGEILGLEADQLVHLDEPGAPATLDQLATLLPALVPDRLDELLSAGVVESCGPDRYCVPSPSLLQLTFDALAADYEPDRVLDLLHTIRSATTAVASATVELLTDRPAGADPAKIIALVTRGRGLLAHGTGRLTIHAIGRELGAERYDDTTMSLRSSSKQTDDLRRPLHEVWVANSTLDAERARSHTDGNLVADLDSPGHS